MRLTAKWVQDESARDHIEFEQRDSANEGRNELNKRAVRVVQRDDEQPRAATRGDDGRQGVGRG